MLTHNKTGAVKPAITSRLQCGYRWRGVDDPEYRSAAITMNTHWRRILVELTAPPFVAAIISIAGDKSSEWYMIILGFVPLLLFFYLFGIIPSVIYAFVMELWFYARLRERCGLICTVAVSGGLGCAAGFVGAWSGIWFGFLTRPDEVSLAKLGAIVGLLVGFYVADKHTIQA